MFYFNRVISLLSPLVLTSLLVLPAISQTLPQQSVGSSPTQDYSTTRNSNSTSTPSIVESIVAQLSADEPPLRPRGPLTVGISPGVLSNGYMTLSDRPLFLWHGSAQRIILRDADNLETILWNQPLNSGSQQIAYTGTPLQPGRTYQWKLIESSNDHEISSDLGWNTFKVMPSERRDAIVTEWQSLETQLKSGGATDQEIQLKKAQFFLNKKLSSDFIQAFYSIPSPTAEIVQAQRQIIAHLTSTDLPGATNH